MAHGICAKGTVNTIFKSITAAGVTQRSLQFTHRPTYTTENVIVFSNVWLSL